MKSMEDSAGSLSSAYGTYMNTTQAHLDQLKAAFTDFSKSIFDSKSTQQVIDFIKSIISFLGDLIKNIGLLNVALAGVGIYKFLKNLNSLSAIGLAGSKNLNMVTAATARMNVEDTKAVLLTTSLNQEQVKQILMTKGVAEAEAEETAATIINNRTQQANIVTTNMATAAWTKLKAAAMGVANVIKAHPVIAAITAAIAIATFAFTQASKAAEKAAEQAKETTNNAIEAANAEKEKKESLDELIQRYEEITKKGYVDASNRNEIAQIQSEINKLVDKQISGLNLVNGNLKDQQVLLKEIQRTELETLYKKQKLAADAAYAEANSEVRHHGASLGIIDTDIGLDNDVISQEYHAGDESYKQVKEIEDILKKSNGLNAQIMFKGVNLETNDPFEEFQGELLSADTIRLAFADNANLGDKKKILEDALDRLEKAGYTVNNSKTVGTLSSIYQDMFGENSTANKAFSLTQEAMQMAILMSNEAQNLNTQKSTSVRDFLEKRNQLIHGVQNNNDIKSWFDSGRINNDDIFKVIDEYLSQINGLSEHYISQGTIETMTQIGDRVYKAYGEKMGNDFGNWWMSLSAEDIEIISAIANQNKTAEIDDSNWGLDDWKKAFDDYKSDVLKGSNEINDAFDSLMKEKGTDSNPSFVERMGNSVEEITKLQEALKKVEDGTITDKEKASLFKSFPQLTAYANNLSAGIKNLTGSMRKDIVKDFDAQIENFKRNGASEEDIQKLEIYKNTILGIIDAYDKEDKTLSSIQSSLKDLDSAIKSYNENGYFSIENLEKLSSKSGQQYLQYLQYENGQLKINEEAYKKLILAQIDEIETKAILQATSELDSIADEASAKEYLAQVNIDLAKSEMSAAEAAFQYSLSLKLAQGGKVAEAAQQIADNLKTLRNIFASSRKQVDDYAAAMAGSATATDKKSKASEKLKSALESEERALEKSKNALENQKKALEKQKNGYDKALKSVKDLVSWVEKYITQIKNDEKKALEERKKDHDKIIEKRKEEIELARKEAETAEKLTELENKHAQNVLAYNIASMDDSSAGKKAQKEAYDNMLESDKNLRKELSDNAYEMRLAELDKDKESFDDNIDKQIEAIDKFLSDEVALNKAACKMIDEDRGELYAKLLQYCLEYTTTTKAEFNHMWQSAQIAIQKYNGDNLTTYSLMNDLQGKMYEVDEAIDTISESISAYETQIDGVKTKLNDLKDAAIIAKNALDDVADKDGNNSFLNALYDGLVQPSSGNGGVPTTNNTTIKKADKSTKSPLTNGNGGKKINPAWKYVDTSVTPYKIYTSDKPSKALAAKDIITQKYGAAKATGMFITSFAASLQPYAKGTRSTKGNVFISQEEGLEAIFGKLQNGNYTLAPEGSQVFNHRMTDTLYNFANNPSSFISNNMGNYERIIRSITNAHSSSIGGDMTFSSAPVYHIYGNVDKDTLNKMDKQEKQRYELFKKQFMLEMLREKNNV